MDDKIFEDTSTFQESGTGKGESISNLDFLSRMLHRDLRGYIKPYYRYLRRKFSEATLDLFVDICDKISDDLITPEVLNAVLPDMGVTDIRKDIIVKNYALILSDQTETLKKSTYERFREIVYREYFDIVNTGSAVETLEKIQNSDFFLPPYGVTNSDNFKQVNFGSFDMQNITEDLGSPLYSHFDEINATSPIKGYLPNQVTMVSGPPGAQTGETKVMTLDHGFKTLEELYKSGAENIEVYCVDDDCNIHVSVAEKCVLTKYTTDLIRITLRNGVTLTATPEHWYRTIDGYWYEACQLKEGMSLTPFNRKVQLNSSDMAKNKHSGPRYEACYTFNDLGKDNAYTHELAKEYLDVNNEHAAVYHNKRNDSNTGFDNLNNEFRNLVLYGGRTEHQETQCKHEKGLAKVLRSSCRTGLMSKLFSKMNPDANSYNNIASTLKMVSWMIEEGVIETPEDLTEETFNCARKRYKKFICNYKFPTFSKVKRYFDNDMVKLFDMAKTYNNYDIIHVEEYHPSEPIPVYDLLNVDKYRNFAVLLESENGVDSGVISHNCFIGSTLVRQPDGTLDTLHNMHEKHTAASVRTLDMDTGEIYWTWKNDGSRKTRKCQEFTRIYISTRPEQPIICTHDHLFVVLDPKEGRKWVEAQNLKEDDILFSTPGIRYVRVTKVDTYSFYKPLTCYDVVNNENSNYFINAGDEEICVHNCFSGDTKVMTLDGGYRTMQELYESKERNFPVYSYNHESGEVEVQKAESCIISKEVDRLCEITFDSGSSIRCTEDHMFPLLTGETVRADELKIGDIIMPINRKHQNLDLYKLLEHKDEVENSDGYEVVYTYNDNGSGNQYTHRLIDKMINQDDNSIDLTIEEIIGTAICLGSPDIGDIATALGCSESAVKSRVYSKFKTSGDFAKYCGFFPIRAENNLEISQEYLVALGRSCHTYKILTLAKESGLSPSVIKKAIKKYFNDCHGFAHALGYTYRGKPKCNGKTIDDLRKLVAAIGPTVSMEDLMTELDLTRQAVVKILEDEKLTFNEFLSTCGIISPTINYIIDKSYYYGTVNLVRLAEEFKTSEENINSILNDNGWTVETLSKAIGRLYSNHKITGIRMIQCEKPVPVYDIVETNHNHNFAIMLDGDKNSSSGIFACQSGKTLFMMTEAVESLLQGKKVLYAAIGDLKPFDFASRICSMLLKSPMTKTALSINSCYEAVTRLYPQVKENLAVQFISPDKYTPNQWLKMNEQLGNIDKYEVFFIDYDTNFASEKDSMYAKGDEVYTMAFTLSQYKGKYVFIGSQPKIGNWKDRELGLESASESSRKQQIVDVMITLSHDRDTRNPRNHLGTINIPKNRRGGTAKFKYILDPTGVMESITDEAYCIFKDDDNTISVIDSANADPSIKYVKLKRKSDNPIEVPIRTESGEVIGSTPGISTEEVEEIVSDGVKDESEHADADKSEEVTQVETVDNPIENSGYELQGENLFDNLDGLF